MQYQEAQNINSKEVPKVTKKEKSPKIKIKRKKVRNDSVGHVFLGIFLLIFIAFSLGKLLAIGQFLDDTLFNYLFGWFKYGIYGGVLLIALFELFKIQIKLHWRIKLGIVFGIILGTWLLTSIVIVVQSNSIGPQSSFQMIKAVPKYTTVVWYQQSIFQTYSKFFEFNDTFWFNNGYGGLIGIFFNGLFAYTYELISIIIAGLLSLFVLFWVISGDPILIFAIIKYRKKSQKNAENLSYVETTTITPEPHINASDNALRNVSSHDLTLQNMQNVNLESSSASNIENKSNIYQQSDLNNNDNQKKLSALRDRDIDIFNKHFQSRQLASKHVTLSEIQDLSSKDTNRNNYTNRNDYLSSFESQNYSNITPEQRQQMLRDLEMATTSEPTPKYPNTVTSDSSVIKPKSEHKETTEELMKRLQAIEQGAPYHEHAQSNTSINSFNNEPYKSGGFITNKIKKKVTQNINAHPTIQPDTIQNFQSQNNSNLTSKNILNQNLSKNDIISQNKVHAEYQAQCISDVMQQFNVPVQITNYEIGSAITRFELKLAPGVKVNRVTGLTSELKLALATRDIRLIAPIPNKSAIGVEVPNQNRTQVDFISMWKSRSEFQKSLSLGVALGETISGDSYFISLVDMPHLLVAGATGSGKSMCLNSILCSLLLSNTPQQLKLVLIDPKRVEFNTYRNMPHLLMPIVNEPDEAIEALNQLVIHMDKRYQMLVNSNTRNIAEYNAKQTNDKNKLPYIVIMIDELADLMMSGRKVVEDLIKRLSQMARAAGIHLVLATQRPSVDVITGTIKTNIPSRIAFAVSSAVDSRTIIDSAGAETLIGKGDMLVVTVNNRHPDRLQGAYVSDVAIDSVINFWEKRTH